MSNQPQQAAPSQALVISRKEAVRRVIRASSQRQPLALIRLGEGEARLLAADLSDSLSMDIARRKIKRQTGLKLKDADILAIRALIEKAIDGSDIVGVLGDEKFNEEHQMWANIATDHVYRRISETDHSTIICHCLVNGDLHENLEEIICHHTHVTVIGCRNVEPIITGLAPDIDFRMLPIPSQFAKRELDDDFERRLHEVRMWPETYRALTARPLVRQPGELFLIGAGLFGKSLCALVKEQGGTALDFGSRLDFMVGKRTRGASKAALAQARSE